MSSTKHTSSGVKSRATKKRQIDAAVPANEQIESESKRQKVREAEENVQIEADVPIATPAVAAVVAVPHPFTVRQLRGGGVFRWDPQFLSAEEAAALFEKLHQTLTWCQSDIKIYGKVIKSPRMQCWMGDDDRNDRPELYLKTEPSPWSEEVKQLKARLEAILGCKFDYLLLNMYRNGNDYIGYHADREAIPEGKGVIASLSLGAVRRFIIRSRDEKEKIEYSMTPGCLIVMDGKTQVTHKHTVPKEPKVKDPRINLTFRIR